jgi:hypothetical protein
VDPRKQEVVVQAFKKRGINIVPLLTQTGKDWSDWSDPDEEEAWSNMRERGVLLRREYRAANAGRRWKHAQPTYDQRLMFLCLAVAEKNLRDPSPVVPSAVKISGEARALSTLAVDGQEHAQLGAAARAQRRGLKKTKKPIAAPAPTAAGIAAFLSAVQQRFISDVRRLIFGYVEPVVRQSNAAELAAHLKVHPERNEADVTKQFHRHTRSVACRLTADFIVAFYPAFGATTTAELVQKSLRPPKAVSESAPPEAAHDHSRSEE